MNTKLLKKRRGKLQRRSPAPNSPKKSPSQTKKLREKEFQGKNRSEGGRNQKSRRDRQKGEIKKRRRKVAKRCEEFPELAGEGGVAAPREYGRGGCRFEKRTWKKKRI